MNPGSVSMPKEDTTNGYILLEGSTFYLKSIDGYVLDTYEL